MSDTEALIAFYRARLDEQATTCESCGHDIDDHDTYMCLVGDVVQGVCRCPLKARDFRKLRAEVEYKRRVLDEAETTLRSHGLCDRCVTCRSIRLLVTVHSDHPDYREEWAPHD